jgi:hypothetical protein
MATTEFQVNGLTREADGAALTRRLCSMPDIAAAHVDVTTGTVTLIRTTPTQGGAEVARRVVRDAGYELASEVATTGAHRRARGPLHRWVRQPRVGQPVQVQG